METCLVEVEGADEVLRDCHRIVEVYNAVRPTSRNEEGFPRVLHYYAQLDRIFDLLAEERSSTRLKRGRGTQNQDGVMQNERDSET